MKTIATRSTESHHSNAGTQRNRSLRYLGAFLIVEAWLAFAPLAILGPAIGWPASLGKLAHEQLQVIALNASAVKLGYGAYFLYSLLIAPLMIFFASLALGNRMRVFAMIAVAFAALSTLARCVGILRWLTIMPELATQHAKGDAQTQSNIELVFRALNSYGGAIGEVLGVSLFMAIALFALCIGALRSSSMPKWSAGLGIVSALLLAALALPTFGFTSIVPITLAVTMLSVWMLATGVACLVVPKRWNGSR